jgi:hypothetical protein
VGKVTSSAQQFVVCISNEGYSASLETRKIYVLLPDAEAEKLAMMRVIDESGEDYLYPKSLFQPISLSAAESKAILAAA